MPGAGCDPGPAPGAAGPVRLATAEQGRRPMTHAALVNGVVFWLVVVMTVLLVMFIYAVITTPRQDAAPAEPPVLEPSALDWTTPAALPAQRPLAPASPAGVTGQPGGTGYPARHITAAAP